ncbi:HAD family hydrolase [Maribacter sp. 2-571]|uniref:HAD family hydrolase n=1 Tax=Maribacter sp. 2-571 TaxID=3417569 RepID=UPI003D33357D
MDFSSVKMVVSDMDGTLLNSNHEVSERFFELFPKLAQHGIRFVAASGRQYDSIIDKLQPIKNEITVIAENGGFAMEGSTEIVSTPLASEKQYEVLELLADIPDINTVLCGKKCAYIAKNASNFLNKLKEYYSSYQTLPELKAYHGELLKIAIYHPESSERYIYPVVAHLNGDLMVKISGPNWVDISSPNAHKGHALQKVQSLYGTQPSETMVFGDYFNDLEMLALADYSFAMANAHPDVKKAAKHSTNSNDDFGVERVLEQLLHINPGTMES